MINPRYRIASSAAAGAFTPNDDSERRDRTTTSSLAQPPGRWPRRPRFRPGCPRSRNRDCRQPDHSRNGEHRRFDTTALLRGNTVVGGNRPDQTTTLLASPGSKRSDREVVAGHHERVAVSEPFVQLPRV